MLSAVLARERWVPPGAGGYGGRAGLGTGPGWHCLSTTHKHGQERGRCAHLPSGAWLAGTGFSSPALSLPPSHAAGHPGLHAESLQGLAPQQPRLGDPFAWRHTPSHRFGTTDRKISRGVTGALRSRRRRPPPGRAAPALRQAPRAVSGWGVRFGGCASAVNIAQMPQAQRWL